MKNKLLRCNYIVITIICQLIFTSTLQAQDLNNKIKINGTISDENGAPLPGASVVIKGTSNGVTSDFDGKYEYTVTKGRTLIFSYLGYITIEKIVEKEGDLSIAMQQDVNELSGVVVTALGIKTDRKAVGYAVDQISSETLNSTGEPSFLLNLAAKAPGVQVSPSANGLDGTPRVLIRGVTSLSSDNQPLYVLDGMPLLSNRSLSESLFTPSNGASDLGNPLSDINPNDIEDITILKGGSSTSLYGARGANGVILITTKKGKAGQKGWGVEITSNITFQSALLLPKSQTEYGQGFNGEYSYVDGNGGGINEDEPRLWGPQYNGQPISQWDPETGGAIVKPWLPYGANNVKNFFETGHTKQYNLSLTHVSETSNLRLSVGHQDVKGIVPNTGLKRITGSLNTSFQLGEKLAINFTATGSKMTSNNRSAFGFGSGALWQSLFVPTNIDIRDLRDYKDEFGNKKTYQANGDNPYWDLHENLNPVERNRFSANIGAVYSINDWISLESNLSRDTNITENERIVAKHLFSDGSYEEGLNLSRETNAGLNLKINRDIYKDLSFNLLLGTATRHEEGSSKFARTDGGLLVREVYNLGNSSGQPTVTNRTVEKKVNSVLGLLELNYKDWAYLTFTGRNDWSSTLPKNAQSFFYPSVSGSFVFTDALNIKSDLISFGKIRASWAKVGNDTQPYVLDRFVTRNSASFNGQPVLGVQNVIPSTSLLPEVSESIEIGGELFLFKNKVKLDVAYYDNESGNQLVQVENAWERGARFAFINAGSINNKGVDVKLNINAINTEDFKWDVNLNWSKNKGTVSGFPEDLVDFKHIAAFFGPEIRATNGEPYGHIVGFEYFRDTQDSFDNVPNHADDYANFGYSAQNNIYGTGKVLTRNGVPLHNQWRGTRDLGLVAPLDWTAAIGNSFRYKNFNLNLLFDIRYGGTVVSTTAIYQDRWGYNSRSIGLNSDGGVIRDDVANGGGFIFDGIDVETGQQNTTAINAQDYISGWNLPTSEVATEATNIKLRELSVGYRFNKELLDILNLSAAKISLTARNLWLIKNNLDGIDSETASMGNLNNGAGFEIGSLPNTKSFGMNLSISF